MKAQKILVGMLLLGIVFIVLVIPGRAQRPAALQPVSMTSAVGTAFSYQGQLKKDGGPVNGTCDFEFSLWNQAGTGTPPTGGTQIGGNQSKSGVLVTGSLTYPFTKYISYFVTPISRQYGRNLPIYRTARSDN